MKASNTIKSKLLSMLVFCYVMSSLALSGIPNWSKLSAGFAAVLWVALFAYSYPNKPLLQKWYLPPILFIAFCGFLTLLGSDTATDMLITTTVAWMGGIAVGLALRDSVSVKVVLTAMVGASLANVIAVLYGFDAYAIYHADLREVSEEVLLRRPTGLLDNPNLLALQAILPIFALFLWREYSNKILYVVGITCAVYAFIVSGSLKGVYLLIAIVVYIIITSINKTSLIKLAPIVILSVIAAPFYLSLLGSGNYFNDVLAIERIGLVFSGQESSFNERYSFIILGWEAFSASPIWGHGLDMFRIVSRSGLYSHNNIIELAVSGGILLLVFYYSIFFHIFRRAKKTFSYDDPRYIRYTLLLCILFLLDFTIVSYSVKMIALILSMMLAIPESVKNSDNKMKAIHPAKYLTKQ